MSWGCDGACASKTGGGPGPRFVGRFDASEPKAVRLAWSGSGFVVRFRGTGAQASLRGGKYFTVIVDGTVRPAPLEVTEVDATYDLTGPLPAGEHTVEVYRRTEARLGATVVRAVEVDGTMRPPRRPTRQIEIVGDSWATGHGVDGPDGDCAFSAATQNHFRSWGAITAREVGAELSTVAWAGKGVLRNEDGGRLEPMPALYDQVLGTEASSTGTVRPADVVFVALGGNDLREGQLPEGFTAAFVALLEQVRARHPSALIACVAAELESPDEEKRLRAAVGAAIAARRRAGDARLREVQLELDVLRDFGCEHHPGPKTHALMAENAVTILAAELGWTPTAR